MSDKKMTLEQMRDDLQNRPLQVFPKDIIDAIDAEIKARGEPVTWILQEDVEELKKNQDADEGVDAIEILLWREASQNHVPLYTAPPAPKIEVTDAMVERALRAPHGGYSVSSFIPLKSPTNIRELMRTAIEAALKETP